MFLILELCPKKDLQVKQTNVYIYIYVRTVIKNLCSTIHFLGSRPRFRASLLAEIVGPELRQFLQLLSIQFWLSGHIPCPGAVYFPFSFCMNIPCKLFGAKFIIYSKTQ